MAPYGSFNPAMKRGDLMTIGWGINGIGSHANRFMGPAIGKAANTKFVAACSRSMERAKEFAGKHGVERAYDYGNQRMSWLCNFFTNWMGDDAFLC